MNEPSVRRGRFDLVTEVLSVDEATRTATLKFEPNPERYDKVEQPDGLFYFDRYLKLLIPVEAMVESLRGVPLYMLNPSIDSASGYAAGRRTALVNEMQGAPYAPPTEQALGHSALPIAAERDLGFLSVDICGSTARRQRDPEGFDQTFRLLARELGTLVGQFQGTILKLTGDGLLAYIDHPAFTRQCDMTADLGLSMLVLLDESINPALAAAGLDPVGIRIGADFGSARVHTVTIPTTGYTHTDIASDALNRAVKIEQSCAPGEFRIGDELHALVHTQWLKRAEEVEFDGATVGVEGYRVYRLR
jgi:class 3 adenylate cyclase